MARSGPEEDEVASVVTSATIVRLSGMTRPTFDRHVQRGILLPSIDFRLPQAGEGSSAPLSANGTTRYWGLHDALRNVCIASIWRQLYRQVSVLHEFVTVAVPDGELDLALDRRLLLWKQKPGTRGALRVRDDRQLAVVDIDGQLLRTTESLLPLPGFSENPLGLDPDYVTTPAQWLSSILEDAVERNLDQIKRDPRLLRGISKT